MSETVTRSAVLRILSGAALATQLRQSVGTFATAGLNLAGFVPTGIRDQLSGRDYGEGFWAPQWRALRRLAGQDRPAGGGDWSDVPPTERLAGVLDPAGSQPPSAAMMAAASGGMTAVDRATASRSDR